MDNIQDLYRNNSCFLAKTMYLDRISFSVFHFKYASRSSPLGKKLQLLNPLGSIRFIIRS